MFDQEGLQQAITFFLGILFVILIGYLVVYIITSVFMSNLHKRIYGEGTILAWLPFTRVYLLGKLAVNKLVGWIYLGAYIICDITVPAQDGQGVRNLIPGGSILVSGATIAFYIAAIIKNGRLKRGELNPADAKVECDSTTFEKKQPQSVPQVQQPIPQQPNPVMQQQPVVPQARFCTNCGATLMEGSSFCTNCGTRH